MPDNEEIRDDHGTRYYSPGAVARLLGKPRSHIDRLIKSGDLASSDSPALLAQLSGKGRRSVVVEAEGVDRRRRQFLQEIGVREEIEGLHEELASVREAWRKEVAGLRGRVTDLESRYEMLMQALKSRGAANAAQVEADRAFLDTLTTHWEG